MVIHIKDEETNRLVRQYAKQNRLGITAAVNKAMKIALSASEASGDTRPLEERLAPLLERLDRLPRPNRGLSTDKAFFDSLNDE